MALTAERSLKLPVCTQEKCNKMLVGIGDYFEGGRGKNRASNHDERQERANVGVY